MLKKIKRPSWGEFDQVEKEIKLACQRTGTSSIDRLRWLMDFAYEDLSHLSRGQIYDRWWEVVALLIPPDFQKRPDRRAIIDLIILEHATPVSSTSKVPEELFRKFHDLLKQGFDDYFKGPGWEHIDPPRKRMVSRVSPPSTGASTMGELLPPEVRLIGVAFDLFEAESDRLGNCRNPNCKRPFVAARKGRAFFCSPRCSAYVRVNTARGKTEKLKGI